MSLEQTIRKLGAKGVSQPLEKDMNDQVHAGGYTSKHFEVSAPAQKLFASLPKNVDTDKAERSVQLHDKLFAIHKKTHASERSTSADMKAAQELHDQIMSLAKEMDLEDKHGHVKDSLDFIKQKFDAEGNVKDDVSSDDVAKRYASPPKDYQTDVKNDADIDNISKFRISRDKRAQRKLKIIDDQYNPGVNEMDRIEKVSPSFLEALKKVQENALELAEKKKMTKADIAALKHPKGKIDANDLAALRAGEHKKKVAEEAKKHNNTPKGIECPVCGMEACPPVKEETLDEAQFIVIQKGMDKKRIRNNPYEIMRARKDGWVVNEDYDSGAAKDKEENDKYIGKREKHGLKSGSWKDKSKNLNKKAVTGMGEEVEELDEITSQLVGRAANKAGKLAQWHSDNNQHIAGKAYDDQSERLWAKAEIKRKKENAAKQMANLSSGKKVKLKKKMGEDVEQVDEILDRPGKELGYALKNIGSKLKAGLTGDKDTVRKRERGEEFFKKNAAKKKDEREMDSYRNKLAGKALRDMGSKTGFGSTYNKIFKEDAEQFDEGNEMQNLAKSQKSAIVKREVQQKKAMFAKKDSTDKAKFAKQLAKEDFVAKAIAILGEEFADWSFEELAEAIVAKKPRGRPRKNPLPDPATPVAKKPRGRPRKDASAAEKKPEDNDKDREHIVMGLRKAISLRGQHGVKFADGSTHQISAEHAQKALKIHDNLSKPSEKMVYQRKLAASHASFKKALDDKNPGGEEVKKTGVTLAKRAEF
jgi:hypothetical protein